MILGLAGIESRFCQAEWYSSQVRSVTFPCPEDTLMLFFGSFHLHDDGEEG